jgi:hypothetical protein
MQAVGVRLLVCVALALSFSSIAAARAPSHQEFITRADAVCRTGNARANALSAPTSTGTTVTYLAKTVAILRHERTAILALAAPVADRPVIRAEMNAVATEAAFFAKAKGAAASNDPSGYDADITQAKSFHDTGSGFAKKLGLRPCEN